MIPVEIRGEVRGANKPGRVGRATDLRLLPAAVAAVVAAAGLVESPGFAEPVAVAAWVLAALLAAILVFSRRTTTGLTCCLLAFIGTAAVATSVTIHSDRRDPAHLLDQRVFVVTATAQWDPGGNTLRAISGTVPVMLVGVDLPSEVDGNSRSPSQVLPKDSRIAIGTELLVRGRIRVNASADSVAARIFLDAGADALQVLKPPPPWLAWADKLRGDFRGLASLLPGDGGALLTGLAIGDDTGVPLSLDSAMKATSLSHLTAVSGGNCIVVIGAAFAAARAIGLPRRFRPVLAVGLLLAFVILVTPQPSVVRAGAMAAIAMAGLAVDRPLRGSAILLLGVTAVLIADPWAAREIGFLLSAAATAGLLLLAPALGQRLARWLPRPLAVTIAVPIAAQIACQPILVVLNPEIAIVGVPANLLAGPAAPLATAIGLLVCLICQVAWPIAHVFSWIAWLPAAWIAAVARTLGDLPGAQLPWPEAPFGAFAATLLCATCWFWAVRTDRAGWIAGRALAAVALISISAFVSMTAVKVRSQPDEWEVAQCDVGQGDALLIRSAGSTALVDAGPDAQLLEACLETLGVKRLELVVLTHFDLDHVGGLEAIIGRADRVLIGTASAEAEAMASALQSSGATVDVVSRGASGILGNTPWRVLWPQGPDRFGESNAGSVVMHFSGDLPVLLLGDLGEQQQEQLLGREPQLRADVLKVAHHGSRDQSARLLATIRAPIALIGVGIANTYGHPADSTLKVLSDSCSQIVRSDRNGLALVSRRLDGTIAVWVQKGALETASLACAEKFAARGVAADRVMLVDATSGGGNGETIAKEFGCRGQHQGRVEVGQDPASPCGVGQWTRAVPGRSSSKTAARSPPAGRRESRGQRFGRRHGGNG